MKLKFFIIQVDSKICLYQEVHTDPQSTRAAPSKTSVQIPKYQNNARKRFNSQFFF